MTARPSAAPLRLNLGCGRNILSDWTNVDWAALPGVDVVADLNSCTTIPLPFDTDSVDEFLLSHVLEHLPNALALMQELHRIAKPGAKAVVLTPYGSSDDAWEDPTHVRPYFTGSFDYFAQPCYWRADYGYRGDWQAQKITLRVPARYAAGERAAFLERLRTQRNLVLEMAAELVAVKPAREPRRELIAAPALNIELV